MNAFKEFIITVSAALIFSGIMMLITPKSGKRQMQIVLSLIVVALVSSSVSCKDADIELPDVSSSQSSSTDSLASVAARQSVEAVLKNAGAKYTELEVFTDNSDSGGIFISRITLKTSEKDMDVAGILKLNFPNAEVETEYE